TRISPGVMYHARIMDLLLSTQMAGIRGKRATKLVCSFSTLLNKISTLRSKFPQSRERLMPATWSTRTCKVFMLPRQAIQLLLQNWSLLSVVKPGLTLSPAISVLWHIAFHLGQSHRTDLSLSDHWLLYWWSSC